MVKEKIAENKGGDNASLTFLNETNTKKLELFLVENKPEYCFGN